MKKVLSAILIVILLLLLIRFGALVFGIALKIGLTLLKIAVRFWYLWIAIFIYTLLRDDSKKRKKKSSKDGDKSEIIDADFTIIDEDEKKNE
jgi:hypothetical protein